MATTALQAPGTHWQGRRAATFRVHSSRRDRHHGLITTGVQAAQKTGGSTVARSPGADHRLEAQKASLRK